MEKHKDEKNALKKNAVIFGVSLLITLLLFGIFFSIQATAATPSITFDIAAGDVEGSAFGPLEMLFLLVILALAPSILIMMTSFTRILIVLSFLRNALGTQQSPPNQIIIGMALMLSLFVMTPVLDDINEVAYKPFKDGTITQEVAIERGIRPLKVFMLKQTKVKELNLFLSISDAESKIDFTTIENPEELVDTLGLEIIVPSFITSELNRAFTIGFLLFIPFLIIDMVVSSTLMSMGMVMLPPSMIALPFKIMTFVLVDGWGLLFGTLVKGFKR